MWVLGTESGSNARPASVLTSPPSSCNLNENHPNQLQHKHVFASHYKGKAMVWSTGQQISNLDSLQLCVILKTSMAMEFSMSQKPSHIHDLEFSEGFQFLCVGFQLQCSTSLSSLCTECLLSNGTMYVKTFNSDKTVSSCQFQHDFMFIIVLSVCFKQYSCVHVMHLKTNKWMAMTML